MFSLYSTCIRNIKKSFAKEYSSGIKKEYEEHDLLGVLKKMKQRDIPKFDSIPSLLGKQMPTDLIMNMDDIVAAEMNPSD